YRVAAPQVGAAPPAGPHPAAGGGHPRAVLAPGGFPAPSGLPNAGAAQPYRQAPAPVFPGNVPGGHGAPKRAGAVGWFVAAAIVLLILVLAVGALLFFS
ncbi:MAG: hypothetical protein J2P18_02770, partial [Nocardia sp.]|nr:hypothetical protein [Nocardia sp.]